MTVSVSKRRSLKNKCGTEALVIASKEIGLEVNAEKTKYMVMSRDQNGRKNGNIQTGNKSFETVEQFKYLDTTLTNQNSIHQQMKSGSKSGIACYDSVQHLLYSSLLSKYVKIKIHRTIILPVVLYGCETWSLTLREECRLRVFENRVLRRILGSKRDEVTGNGEDYITGSFMLCTPHQILMWLIKARGMRWTWHVARMGERRGAYMVLLGKLKGRRPPERCRCRWEDNTKMDL